LIIDKKTIQNQLRNPQQKLPKTSIITSFHFKYPKKLLLSDALGGIGEAKNTVVLYFMEGSDDDNNNILNFLSYQVPLNASPER